MSINKDNYELFVMDYLEGNLEEMKKQEMAIFLLLHPHIAIEIDDLADIKLDKETDFTLDNKFTAALKKNTIIPIKNINEDNYEHFFIAYLENDLNSEDDKTLQKFLKRNSTLIDEFQQLQTVKIIPDDQIIFPHKKSLQKKERKSVILWPLISSIAALLLWSFWLLKPHELNRAPNMIEKMESKTLSGLLIDIHPPSLTSTRTLFVKEMVQENVETTETLARNTILLDKMVPIEKEIQISDEQWKNEMLLMQSFAFERNQLYSQLDVSSLPDEKKHHAFRIISSLVWKTTKGQIKNLGDEIIQDELKIWQAGRLEALTDGYVSVKPKSTE